MCEGFGGLAVGDAMGVEALKRDDQLSFEMRSKSFFERIPFLHHLLRILRPDPGLPTIDRV